MEKRLKEQVNYVKSIGCFEENGNHRYYHQEKRKWPLKFNFSLVIHSNSSLFLGFVLFVYSIFFYLYL